MLANIALLADVQLALRYGAEGIGLLRSEFSFLTYEDFPDETQQFALYNQMLESFGKRPVTIRTLDIGADKYPPYMRVPREDNPFLGWRSIRISLEMSGLFKVQLRAILRAAAQARRAHHVPDDLEYRGIAPRPRIAGRGAGRTVQGRPRT